MFIGLELTKNKKEVKWEEDEEDELDSMSETVLELRQVRLTASVGSGSDNCPCWQACLGAGAKEGERNVVEVTTENAEGDMVTHTILSLRVGATEQVKIYMCKVVTAIAGPRLYIFWGDYRII